MATGDAGAAGRGRSSCWRTTGDWGSGSLALVEEAEGNLDLALRFIRGCSRISSTAFERAQIITHLT